MKKIIFFILCCICGICTTHAQKTYTYKWPQLTDTLQLPKNLFPDSSFKRIPYFTKPYTPLIAGAMPKKLYYLGNNGQGIDIYQTPHDNTYILKPDSTFLSNMPVSNTINLQYKPVAIPNPQQERFN